MARLRIPCLVACLLPVGVFPLRATILDLGAEYRLRGITVSNPDFSSKDGRGFLSHRMRLYLSSHLSPQIELATKLQAIGVVGSTTATVTDTLVNPAGSRYPNTQFTPWIEHAYLTFRAPTQWPAALTVGRQPILIGDGLLLSDDGVGLTGVRAQTKLPLRWDVGMEVFTFKAIEKFHRESDLDLFGALANLRRETSLWELFWLLERDHSGTKQPNPVTGDDTNVINRYFVDLRLDRQLQGAFYKLEGAMQRGRVEKRDPLKGNPSLGGFAFLFTGGFVAEHQKLGELKLSGVFGQASGNDGGGTDKGFRPNFGHQFDGLERHGFGEYYGASLYDVYGGLPTGHSGVRVMGGGGEFIPRFGATLGLFYYLFSSREQLGSAASTDNDLGSEFDATLAYRLSKLANLRCVYATFLPGTANKAGKSSAGSSSRFSLEAAARF